jgi:hypothetical protein
MEADMIDAAGTMWILIAVIGAVILAFGLFYASQQAKDAPRDAVTLRLKREQTKENFSDAAVEEKPIFSDVEKKQPLSADIVADTPRKKRRPRVSKQATSRRRQTHPSSHATH